MYQSDARRGLWQGMQICTPNRFAVNAPAMPRPALAGSLRPARSTSLRQNAKCSRLCLDELPQARARRRGPRVLQHHARPKLLGRVADGWDPRAGLVLDELRRELTRKNQLESRSPLSARGSVHADGGVTGPSSPTETSAPGGVAHSSSPGREDRPKLRGERRRFLRRRKIAPLPQRWPACAAITQSPRSSLVAESNENYYPALTSKAHESILLPQIDSPKSSVRCCSQNVGGCEVVNSITFESRE